MSDPKPKGELVNRSRCARTFGVAVTTLDAWMGQGCPVYRKSPRRGVETLLDTGAVHEWRLAHAIADTTPDDLDAQHQKARLLQAQAGLAELELAHRRGELVSVAEIRKADEHVMLVLRDRLLAIPTACAAAAVEAAHRGGERAVAGVVKREIVGAMADLATAEVDGG